MTRVLLSAPNDKPWSPGRPLELALRDLGHEVLLFDFRSAENPNEQILRAAEKFQPHVHVVWKGECYRPETFHKLAALGVYDVLWHPDISIPLWLPPLARASDLCCVQSRGMLDPFRKAGIDNPEWLMEGMTPSCFVYDTITPEERKKYDCDVVIVGTVGASPGYLPRLRALNRLIREKVRVRWWGRRLPHRLSTLFTRLSPAARAWGGSHVWNGAYAKALHCAKICLTLPPQPEATGGLSNSAFMATGVGAFLLSLYRKGMEEFFELDKEVAVFYNEDEMVDKVRYYLAHDAERKAIAEAGRRRTLNNYTNHHAFRQLFQIIAQRSGPV